MSSPSFIHRQLFRKADVTDKITFFHYLLDNRELTSDVARALLHVIHAELRVPTTHDAVIYKHYTALIESFRAQMPGVYQQVFGQRRKEDYVREHEVSDHIAGVTWGKITITFSRIAKYILIRLLAICATIFIGVFVTVLLANLGGQVDLAVTYEVTSEIDRMYPGWRWTYVGPEDQAIIDQAREALSEAAGLNLPYWPRQVLWTFKALRLDWSQETAVKPAPGSFYPSKQVKDIILTDFPHTLLLIGAAFLLLFLLGIPLALHLFRKQGGVLDKLVTMLAPISSIPSWVLGIILILIFAATLHLLPVEGMFDVLPADTSWQRMLIVLKHMVLPVSAILLSLFFQCVYSWRTFLLLYSEEDYVELAKAKGLSNRVIGQQYILRPTLIYILTSFAIMLTGFWQMTIALEKVINWPGIGRLYILTLPNFLGESFYPGIMQITISIVVLFAYLMGITVFILDISYALVDPRVRIGDENQTVKEVAVKARRRNWLRRNRKAQPAAKPTWAHGVDPSVAAHVNPEMKISFSDWFKTLRKKSNAIKPVFREIVRYPSAVFGLITILFLVGGSIYAITAFPYDQLGRYWYTGMLSGKVHVPKFAQPVWVNWFRKDKLPATMVMNSQDGTANKVIQSDPNGGNTVTITYTFDYPFTILPQDLFLYTDATYEIKRPFASITWVTPDGRAFELGSIPTEPDTHYDFSTDVPFRRILSQNIQWRSWFEEGGNYPTPRFYLLFADPAADQAVALPGTYTMRINGITFERNSDIDVEFVLLGQIHGVAGTDYMRRDLLVPLLWGMPFALVFGLLGACVATIFSMLVAATGAWFGGWVDRLVQWMVEANMVLPIIAISVLIYSYFNTSIWTLLGIIVLLNVFGGQTKSFRSAIMQVKMSPYIEAAKAYGASNGRIIFHYLIPRIIPIMIPQLVSLIPSYVFLEATLGIFNVNSIYPTWGRVIYEALKYGVNWGSPFWVLEPISLLLLTGLAFTMLGFALERILNPKLRVV